MLAGLRSWICFILLLHTSYFFTCLVESKIAHIYPFTRPQTVVAKLGVLGQTRFTFDFPQSDEHIAQVLSVELQSGDVFLITKPECWALQSNPLIAVVKSRSVSEPSEWRTRQLKVYFHGQNCPQRRKHGSFTVLPREAPLGSRVFQLRDIIPEQSNIDPSDLRLVNPVSRNFFGIDRTSGYLMLRRTLLGKQERILKVEVAYPAPEGAKQTLLARLRVFIDDRTDLVKRTRRLRRGITLRPPRFSDQHMTASVLEGSSVGTTVVRISASDPNSGSAGILRYSMSPSQNLDSKNYFQINSANGIITTKMTLDREKMSMHYFRVRAEFKENPHLYTQSELSIKVDDINDNSPKFEQPSYSKTVPEDLGIGDAVIQVRAIDEDTGSNAEMHYCFENSGGANADFRIGERSGSVTVENFLDREKVSQYTLQIKAEDRGNPRKSATVNLKIILSDVNDNAPQFLKSSYSATVQEDEKPGSLIKKVNATDKDQGSNSAIFYEIVGGNDQSLFSINRLNGEIKVSRTLDYERMSFYSLLISAQDKGKPPQFNQATVDITLLDINDNAPQFVSSHFLTSIQESVTVSQIIYKVAAVDSDDGVNGEIVYSITTPNMPFSVNAQTGDIKTTQKLDREKIPKYTFSLKAQDKGKPPKEGFGQMTVTLVDVNDNPPVFSKPVYYSSVAEDSRWGTTILKVSAKDPDAGMNNVFYSIDSSGDKLRCFRVSSQGTITLSCRLDYNRVKHYSFVIKASDGTLESSAVVYVNVTDSNTFPPVFGKRIYRASIKEGAKLGTPVLTVVATDRDHGSNAKISYSFEKDVPDFSVDPDTGQIKTGASLDRETKSAYSIEVSATDHGSPAKRATAFVYITLNDVNDNAPVFTKSLYIASLKENVPPPKTVVSVSAVDKDEGSNKAVQYSLASTGKEFGSYVWRFE